MVEPSKEGTKVPAKETTAAKMNSTDDTKKKSCLDTAAAGVEKKKRATTDDDVDFEIKIVDNYEPQKMKKSTPTKQVVKKIVSEKNEKPSHSNSSSDDDSDDDVIIIPAPQKTPFPPAGKEALAKLWWNEVKDLTLGECKTVYPNCGAKVNQLHSKEGVVRFESQVEGHGTVGIYKTHTEAMKRAICATMVLKESPKSKQTMVRIAIEKDQQDELEKSLSLVLQKTTAAEGANNKVIGTPNKAKEGEQAPANQSTTTTTTKARPIEKETASLKKDVPRMKAAMGDNKDEWQETMIVTKKGPLKKRPSAKVMEIASATKQVLEEMEAGPPPKKQQRPASQVLEVEQVSVSEYKAFKASLNATTCTTTESKTTKTTVNETDTGSKTSNAKQTSTSETKVSLSNQLPTKIVDPSDKAEDTKKRPRSETTSTKPSLSNPTSTEMTDPSKPEAPKETTQQTKDASPKEDATKTMAGASAAAKKPKTADKTKKDVAVAEKPKTTDKTKTTIESSKEKAGTLKRPNADDSNNTTEPSKRPKPAAAAAAAATTVAERRPSPLSRLAAPPKPETRRIEMFDKKVGMRLVNSWAEQSEQRADVLDACDKGGGTVGEFYYRYQNAQTNVASSSTTQTIVVPPQQPNATSTQVPVQQQQQQVKDGPTPRHVLMKKGFDATKLMPVRRKATAPVRPRKLIELVELSSGNVLVVFRGLTDASRALALPRQAVTACCLEHDDGGGSSSFGPFTLRYAQCDAIPVAYEYGAHKEDYKVGAGKETHKQIMSRWSKMYDKDLVATYSKLQTRPTVSVYQEPAPPSPPPTTTAAAAASKPRQKSTTTAQQQRRTTTTTTLSMDECIVCQNAGVQVVFEPCRHSVLCRSCAQTSCKRYCPLCRTPITGVVQPSSMCLVRPKVYSAYSFM